MALHTRLAHLYETACDCPACKTIENVVLATENKEGFKEVLNAGAMAFKRLHKNGNYKPEDLANTKEYQDLIKKTSSVFSDAIKDNDVPEEMAKALNEDVFVFSGLKTHAQLFEASRLLKKEDGKIKSFNEFANDFNKINEKYNQQYLQAEHQFAISAAQGAGNWANLQTNTERYVLQYRTASDDRVRASHQSLHLVTLPKDDPFWTSYYPPNGWRCRCVAIEVRADKYANSDSEIAIKAGETATTHINASGKNALAIFRFNPGQQKLIFPPKHPYQPQYCYGSKLNLSRLIGFGKAILSAESDRCKAKQVVQNMIVDTSLKSKVSEVSKDVRKSETGTINTKKFGEVLISKVGFKKTENINRGNYNNQIAALSEIKNLKKHLNDFDGEIKIMPVNNKEKAIRKANIFGYVLIETKDGSFEIALEKDNAIKEDYKFYYIKKVINP